MVALPISQQPRDNTTTTRSHHDNVEEQFSSQTDAYLTSAVYSSGRDLQCLGERLSASPQARVLDMGCGAGHTSFAAAQHARQVMTYDLSPQMLEVVAEAAEDRDLGNVATRQGYAGSLPFEDSEFDVVINRHSAHYWHDVGRALREMNHVLKPGGVLIVMDVMSPSHPVRDIWLQTVEALRGTSHVRNCSGGEWLSLVNDASLIADTLLTDRLSLEFSLWAARVRTPAALGDTIHAYQQSASTDVKAYFALQEDGSFTSGTVMVEARKAG